MYSLHLPVTTTYLIFANMRKPLSDVWKPLPIRIGNGFLLWSYQALPILLGNVFFLVSDNKQQNRCLLFTYRQQFISIHLATVICCCKFWQRLLGVVNWIKKQYLLAVVIYNRQQFFSYSLGVVNWIKDNTYQPLLNIVGNDFS